MRLSDIRGERVFDVIADLIEPIANIAEDKAAMEMFQRKPVPEGEDPRGFVLRRVRASLPALLKEHKSDMVQILAALAGVPPDEYARGLTLPGLVNDVVDALSDEAFASLFTAARSE